MPKNNSKKFPHLGVYNFGQSGLISPNLVTLMVDVSVPSLDDFKSP